MYITREEATDVLYGLLGTGILDQKIEDSVEEIAMIISHEKDDNLSLWGADDEAVDLFVAKREDLITPEWTAHLKELYDKYKMT